MFNETFWSKPHNNFLMTLVLVFAVIALGAYAYLAFKQADRWNSGPTTITITGQGEVLVKPDIAQFSFSVRAEGEDAATAQTQSATAINTIMSYLKEKGIDEKDIKTEGYNLYPRYTYTERPCILGSYCPPGEQIPDGFEVSQMVSVKVRAIDTAGELLAGVGERGATDISGLGFTVDDDDALKAEARQLAIADAKAKAKLLADDLGVRLVKLIGYYEDQSNGVPYYGMGGDMAKESMVTSVAPEISTGENKTVSTVNLTYEIK